MMTITISASWWTKPVTVNLRPTGGHNTEVSLPDGRNVQLYAETPLEAFEQALKMSIGLK